MGLKDTGKALSKVKGHLVGSVATQSKLARLEKILQSQSLLTFAKGLNFQESIFGRSPEQSTSGFVADIQSSKNGNGPSPLELGRLFMREGKIWGATGLMWLSKHDWLSKAGDETLPVSILACVTAEEVWAGSMCYYKQVWATAHLVCGDQLSTLTH